MNRFVHVDEQVLGLEINFVIFESFHNSDISLNRKQSEGQHTFISNKTQVQHYGKKQHEEEVACSTRSKKEQKVACVEIKRTDEIEIFLRKVFTKRDQTKINSKRNFSSDGLKTIKIIQQVWLPTEKYGWKRELFIDSRRYGKLSSRWLKFFSCGSALDWNFMISMFVINVIESRRKKHFNWLNWRFFENLLSWKWHSIV